MDKKATSHGTCGFVGLFPHIKPQTEIASLCTPSCRHTQTHTELGLAVNSAGNIICWGTAAGSLRRQNGRVGSLSQTQTTPNAQTRTLLAQRERLVVMFVAPPFSGSQTRGRRVTHAGWKEGAGLDPGSRGSDANATPAQFSRLSALASFSPLVPPPARIPVPPPRRCPGLSSPPHSAVFITKGCRFGAARWRSELSLWPQSSQFNMPPSPLVFPQQLPFLVL